MNVSSTIFGAIEVVTGHSGALWDVKRHLRVSIDIACTVTRIRDNALVNRADDISDLSTMPNWRVIGPFQSDMVTALMCISDGCLRLVNYRLPLAMIGEHNTSRYLRYSLPQQNYRLANIANGKSWH